jgi:hypothetical protein
VRGKGEELGIVERPLVGVPQDDDLHVVVQTGRGHTTQVREGADVFAQRGWQVLSFDETQVLPT